MFITILIIAAALIVGGLCGYLVFRYVLTGKYKEMIDTATKEADVIKEKKLLEVKEKFLNKKSELEKEVQQRNQKIQQGENRKTEKTCCNATFCLISGGYAYIIGRQCVKGFTY